MNQQSPQSKSPQRAGLSSGRRGSHLSDGAGLEGDGHGHRVAVYGEDGPRSGGWLGKLCITVHNCANKFMDILAIMIDHNPILTDMFFGFFFFAFPFTK